MQRGKNRWIRSLLILSVTALFLGITVTAKATDSLRVLFVGNSYTYYNSMPQLFKAMVESRFPDLRIKTKFVGGGGATLKQHWETGIVSEELETSKWDYVVLQGQSTLGTGFREDGKWYFGSPDQFFFYTRKLDQLIKANGAKTILYMTWAKKAYPNQQKYLTYAYMHIAKELGSRVAPVGIVWDNLRTSKSFELYRKDGSHPTIHGSFLAGATLFSVIFNTVPTRLPGRLEGYKILRGGRLASEKSLLCNLSERDVKTIENAVAIIFEKLQNNNGYLDVKKAVSNKKPSLLSYISRLLTTSQGQAVILLVIALFVLAVKGVRRFSKPLQ
ncbi:MAG: hypothetical protein PVI44_03765 [Balneolaceae bacterium]